MKITKLEVRNFIGIEETSIDPKKMNIISGKNGKGKTSIIEAIKAAFRGADQNKIRVGESKAEIFLATDELEIKRSITVSGGSVTVIRDGKILPKPQTFLNGIIGDFSFEPVKFFTMSANEQTEYLLKVIPVKATLAQLKTWTGGLMGGLEPFTEIHGLEATAAIAETLYQERHGLNAKVKQLESAGVELKGKIPAGLEPVDLAELNSLMERISNAKAAQGRMDDTIRQIEALNKDIVEIEEQIVDLTEKANTKRKEAGRLQEALVSIDLVNVDELSGHLAELQKAQAYQRDLDRLDTMRVELREARGKAEQLDKAVKTLQKDAPAELMAEANMPVDGLAFADGTFTLNNVPIQNLSSSEKTRMAIVITRQLNSGYDVKAICLDGFEALDSDTQKAFIAEAGKDDFQYFITKVADLDKVKVDSHA